MGTPFVCMSINGLDLKIMGKGTVSHKEEAAHRFSTIDIDYQIIRPSISKSTGATQFMEDPRTLYVIDS